MLLVRTVHATLASKLNTMQHHTPPSLPTFYSFNRCPYAMRARMAISYSGISVELREVVLRNKPQAMLLHSPKGTVPVLVLPNGTVIEESFGIMRWALAMHDPQNWLCNNERALCDDAAQLIHANDHVFKQHLDHYKYSTRHTEYSREHYRTQGEIFLRGLESRLQHQRFLLAERMTLSDIAIAPFVRQFAQVDADWFANAPYIELRRWLESILDSTLFTSVMTKRPPWQPGDDVVTFPEQR